jgi:hypothetical protein
MKPFKHDKGSVKRWGGKPEDYAPISDFIDSSKMAMPDMRHRAALHHAFGCYVVERVFGRTIINSDGVEVSTREIAENHIIEDLGFLPSLEDFLDELPLSKWHGGIHRLAKDERPPTPAEKRMEQRLRVTRELFALGCPPSAGMVDRVIRAVIGASEHQEEE